MVKSSEGVTAPHGSGEFLWGGEVPGLDRDGAAEGGVEAVGGDQKGDAPVCPGPAVKRS